MQKRFSWVAFIAATLIHLAGTWALFADHFRALAEWKRTGVDYNPIWLAVLWWIWVPIPLLIRRAFSLFAPLFAQGFLFGSQFPFMVVVYRSSFRFSCAAFFLAATPKHLTMRCSERLAASIPNFP
jgi:hypothetical protein